MRRSFVVALALSVAAPAAPAQDRLWVAPGAKPAPDFGRALRAFGDEDGDGVGDVTALERGVAWRILSGAGGAELRRLAPSLAAFSLRGVVDGDGDALADYVANGSFLFPSAGRLLAGVDGSLLRATNCDDPIVAADVDGDGLPEIAGLDGADLVALTRGLDGALLWSTTVPARGLSLAAIADVDGDGLSDLAATSAPPPAGLGSIVLLSSASGLVVAFGGPAAAASPAQHRLGTVADRDGDGRDEIALWNPEEGGLFPALHGALWIVSPATLATLARVDGDDRRHSLRFEGDVGDFDGDGTRDFALRFPQQDEAVELRSGATLRPLARFRAEQVEPDFPSMAVAPLGDVDGDGCSDLAIGRPDEDRVTAERGRRVALSIEPWGRRLPPPSMNPMLRQFGNWNFRVLITGLRPGTPLVVELVEHDGLAYGPVVLRQSLADANGEVDGSVTIRPLEPTGFHTYGLRATGTAASGAPLTTSIERCAYD